MTMPLAGAATGRARQQSEVTVHELDVRDIPAASDLLADIWQRPISRPIDVPMMIALAHAGNSVAGAFDGDRVVGVCVGFFGTPLGKVLHSQIAGVAASHAGRGVGRALKEHQREWCRERGIEAITWTFDPLVARNAYFNIHRLGADVAQYVVDFYGEMDDALNSGQGSDRVLVRWGVDAPARARALSSAATSVLSIDADGRPLTATTSLDATVITLAVPPDIESMRRADPALASRWRHALRDALPDLVAQGWRVVDFDRAGHYVLERS